MYAATRRNVEKVVLALRGNGVDAVGYHAGMEDTERNEAQERFLRGEVSVVVATNAFGMGIDKANVRLVIHYAMPGTLEAYYQEAGRAGRDGKPGACYLLHAFPDRFTHEFFIKSAYPERPLVDEVYQLLRRNADAGGAFDLSPEDIASREESYTGQYLRPYLARRIARRRRAG